MLKGLLLAVSFLKPLDDARRVVEGAGMEAHQLFPPALDQILSKVCEVAFESAPQAFVQIWVLVLILSTINQPPPSVMQFLSILSSALTAAFVVASASCEFSSSGKPSTLCPN